MSRPPNTIVQGVQRGNDVAKIHTDALVAEQAVLDDDVWWRWSLTQHVRRP